VTSPISVHAYSDKSNENRTRCGGKAIGVRESRRMKIKVEFDEVKYAAVLGQYQPRPIHTEKEHQRAIDMLEGLGADGELTPELCPAVRPPVFSGYARLPLGRANRLADVVTAVTA
jgi:hypothetical protein